VRGDKPYQMRDLLGFIAFSHDWTWLFWGAASIGVSSVWDAPHLYLFMVGGIGVVLGGTIMSRIVYGQDGLRELARSIVDVRRIEGRWWAVTLFFFPVLAILAAALASAAGGVTAPFEVHEIPTSIGALARLLAAIGFILVIGPLPEEIGWRGYLQRRLESGWTALAASLAVGVLWWTWHLPLFLLPGYYDAFGGNAPHPLDLLYGILPAAVLYAWVYANTNRSVLAAILFHFTQNLTGELLGIVDAVRVYERVLLVIAAVLVVWWWGPQTLRRSRQP
jgi:uncharacterized protein